MDFDKNIFENRKTHKYPFLVAHSGVYGANIPCNTLKSFEIAINQGADVIELDVSKSKDGKFFVFHPGKEKEFLHIDKSLENMTSDEIEKLYLYNYDGSITSYKIPTLEQTLEFLKDKVYINVDKFWSDVENITKIVYELGVEKQIIIKTFVDTEILEQVKIFAKNLMFIPIVKGKDNITEKLIEIGVNVIGCEILFDNINCDVISDKYISSMHDKKLLIWANSIVYNEKEIISANKTDDLSLTNFGCGWQWLIDKKVDFIQTDWLLALKCYIEKL